MTKLLQKKSISFLSSLLCLCLCICLASCAMPAAPSDPRAFDASMQDLFVREMKKNTINLHYTLSDPKAFGIKSHQISLGSLRKEDAASSLASAENILQALSRFDYNALDDSRHLTFDIVKDFCEKELASADFYYYYEPLRPTTGTQSELPVLLAEYEFRRPYDVTDYLALLSCIEDYFEEISLFEQEKAALGLFMPDSAADTVIAACRTFALDPETNYLVGTFDSRIDDMPGIPEEKKEWYKKKNRSLVEHIVAPAYEKLADTLAGLKGSGEKNAGLCNYPKGKEYYSLLVRSYTGSEKSIPQLQAMTKRRRNLDLASLNSLLKKDPSLADAAPAALSSEDPKAILTHLCEAMQEDFYPAADESFEINYVHPSLEESLAPAFYLTAPIDDISRNVIYLNRRSRYFGIRLFTTLAHEGYPGHLYQTTGTYRAGFPPVRALFNYPGYVEGWATYVEMLSYRYAGQDAPLADMMMYNQSALLSLYASVDMGIHYDGWQLSDTTAFLNSFHITDKDAISGIYKLIMAEPGHYLKYYIGYLEFLELKKDAKKTLGKEYCERSFHQAILRIGPAPFPILKKYFYDFYGKSSS